MSSNSILSMIGATVLITACTTLPSGPSIVVMPGTGKTFDQFRENDLLCREYAHAQSGGKTPEQAATESVQKSALTGALLGTAFGAAVGGAEGAAIGAASGLLVGSAAGSNTGHVSAGAVQQRYDTAFIQCMYAKGNRVPVSGQLTEASMPNPYPPPPPSVSTPAPTPDFYPLPPPDFTGIPPDFTGPPPPGS